MKTTINGHPGLEIGAELSRRSKWTPPSLRHVMVANGGGGKETPRGMLNTKQTAHYLGMSESFLEKDRWRGAEIPYCIIGRRSVGYRLDDLESYLQNQKRVSTSQVPPLGGGR